MTQKITFTNDETINFTKAFNQAKKLCIENQWAIGIGEMAIGAGLVAWGVNNGVIEVGTQLVATRLMDANTFPLLGAAMGGGLGAVAGSIIGAIGVAAMGGAIGIPAILVAGGAAAVLSMAGYTSANIFQSMATHSFNFSELAANGSALLLGVSLIVDGAQRIIKNRKVLAFSSQYKEKSILLKTLPITAIARINNEHQGGIQKTNKPIKQCLDATISMSSTTIGACIGATTGSAIAASSVTILGSHSLGVAAVAMGLVSAPAWPVLVGIAGGAGIGFSAYKGIKYAWTKIKN